MMDKDYQGPAYNKQILHQQKKRKFNQSMTSRVKEDWQLDQPAILRHKPVPSLDSDRHLDSDSFHHLAKRKLMPSAHQGETQEENRPEEINQEPDPNHYQIPYFDGQRKPSSHSLSSSRKEGPALGENLDSQFKERLNYHSDLDNQAYNPYNLPEKLQQADASFNQVYVETQVDESMNSSGSPMNQPSLFQEKENPSPISRDILLRMVKPKESYLLFEKKETKRGIYDY